MSATVHAAVIGVIWWTQGDVGIGVGRLSQTWHSPDHSFNDDPGPGHLFDVLQAPDVRRVRLVSPAGDARTQGLAWWSPTNGIWLAVDGLEPARRGATYALWFVVPGRPAVVAGTVRTDATGSGRLLSLGKWAEGPTNDLVLTITEARAPSADFLSGVVRLTGPVRR